MRTIDSLINQNYYTIKWLIRYSSTSLHKRSVKKEAVDFIYALSGPLHSRVLLVTNLSPQKGPIVQFDTEPEHGRAYPAQKRPFHATKDLGTYRISCIVSRCFEIGTACQMNGKPKLMKLCDPTNHVACYWTLVFSCLAPAILISFHSWLDIGLLFQVQWSQQYRKKLKSERLSGSSLILTPLTIFT